MIKAIKKTWKDRLMDNIGQPKIQNLPAIDLQVKGKLGAHKLFNDKLLEPIKKEIAEIEEKRKTKDTAKADKSKEKTDVPAKDEGGSEKDEGRRATDKDDKGTSV